VHDGLHVEGQVVGSFEHVLAPFQPRLRHRFKNALKGRQLVTVFGGKIGATVKGLEVRRQEHRHRPAAVPRQDLHGRHVDLIEIGPFLAIHFDADEMCAEELAHLGVLEAFMLHHVAPVTGRIADAQKDGPIQLPRQAQGLFAPGKPVDRIMGMLL